MAIDPQTRQQLLELAYDLLPAAEAALLRRRIKAEPELSKAYAQIRHELKLVAEAAKIEASQVALRRPAAARHGRASKRRRNLRDRLKVRWPLMRGANWVVGLLAACFSAIALGGFWYHHEQLSGIAAEQLRLLVIGPSNLQSGAPAVYTIETTSVTGAAMPARVEFSVLLPSGLRLWRDKDECDRQGRLCIRLPADLKIPPEARLDVLSVSQGSYSRLETPLRITPSQLTATLTTDCRVVAPGQSLRWRLDLAALDLAKQRPCALSVELLDPTGGKTAGLLKDVVAQQGVGFGEFALPAAIAEGCYTLAARSRDGAFAEVRRPIYVHRLVETPKKEVDSASPPEDAAKETPPSAAPSKVRVAIFPEGGALAADVENRVYFLARDNSGAPVAVQGALCDSHGSELVSIASQERGIGTFRFTPLNGESYHLKISAPPETAQEAPIGRISDDAAVALSVSSSLIEADAPLQLSIRTRRAGMPLVATVCCRGVVVAQEPLVTGVQEGGLHAVTVPLGPEASGVLCVSVFDCSASPPRGVAERLVYRHAARHLLVRAEGIEKKYAPDATAALRLAVANEQAKSVDAVLGVAAFAASWEAGPIESSGDLEAECGMLDTASSTAAASIDRVLGVYGWRRFVPRQAVVGMANQDQTVAPVPAVFDNIEQLRETYRKNLVAYRAHRTRLLMFLTMLSLLGGVGVVLLVGMLVLLRVATGTHLWVMALSAAVCCVAAAAVLAYPSHLHSGDDTATSFAPFDGAPLGEQAAKEAGTWLVDREYAEQALGGIEPAGGPSDRAALWMPFVPTTQGTAEVKLGLPATPGTLLLQIDARGDGRSGRQRFPIVVE